MTRNTLFTPSKWNPLCWPHYLPVRAQKAFYGPIMYIVERWRERPIVTFSLVYFGIIEVALLIWLVVTFDSVTIEALTIFGIAMFSALVSCLCVYGLPVLWKKLRRWKIFK